MQWHYTKDSEQFGPVDEEVLRDLVQHEVITKDDLVWNHTMGDKWVPLSSVKSIYSVPPPVTETNIEKVIQRDQPVYDNGTTHNRDLMRMARESLDSFWGLGVLTTFLYQLMISVAPAFIPFVGNIAALIIAGPLAVGLNTVFISLARRKKADVEQLFIGFNNFGTALGAYLLMGIYVFLWLLLLIIPGIIAAYSYSMTFYIIADDPTIKANDAITRSKEMMRGNKWKFFCLNWRFFGWSLLCLLTLGIGYLWLLPYMQTAFAHFYDDVKAGNTRS